MTHSVGDRLGRYEIIDALGSGGMGEVYRARDTELERDVAVKVLPEGVSQDPDRLERFRREAKAIAKLSHPNILEIYDFGHEREVAYLVTEVLEGESLRERLGSAPLSWREAAAIGAHAADALAVAHERGIVHRDIKPANLFLTKDGRVKILDFGLARTAQVTTPEAATEVPEETITQRGAVLGTVGYMSPEQARGQPADHRSDIFSLGCVLYEMMAGQRAFERQTGADTMAAILAEEPEELTTLGVEVPPDLEDAILRCLDKTPDGRFQSASDLGYVLRAVAPSSGRRSEVRPAPAKKFPRLLIPIGAVIVLAAIALVLWWQRGRQSPPTSAQPEFDPNRVVVAVFDNRTGEPALDSLGLQVADSITELLHQVERAEVAVNPPSSITHTVRPLDAADNDPLAQLAGANRAGLVVAGAYYLHGSEVELQAKIVDPWQDEVRQTFDAVRAPRPDPSPAVETLSQRVAGTLALHFDNVIPLGLSQPVQLAAYHEFEAGLNQWGIDRASRLSWVKRALVVDPTFHLARSYLISAYIGTGMAGEAETELEALEDQLPTMTPFDRLAVRSARARLEGHHLEVLRATRQAVDLAPNSFWFLLDLGIHAIAANRPREAVEALSRIPHDWATGGTARASVPFYCLCFAHHMLGDYEEELRVAAESHEHFPDRMVFYGLQAGALAAMGRFEEMEHIVEESSAVSTWGSTWGFSHTFTARELRAHGFRERSLELAERVVEWYRERPDEMLWSPYGSAPGYVAALNVAERWNEALEVAAELAQDRPDEVQCLGLLGVLEARIGNEDGARRIAEQLLTWQGRLTPGEPSFWRACIAAQLGQRDEAMRLLQRAASEGLPFSDEPHRDINLEPLWDYPPFQELIAPKG